MDQGVAQRPVLAGRWEYDPDDELSSGHNALIFGGRDLKTGEEIVVKVFSDAPGKRERFLREARLHKELRHEAILELLDQGSTDDVDYIVTPRLRPGDLWGVIRRQRLSPATTLLIGTRIADALAYLHARGEAHGDISPGNILLDGASKAYLADFGLSKRIATVQMATTGENLITPGFAAPREPGTQRNYEDDVYGLAAVLWFCLTGVPPSDSPRVRRRQLPNRALRVPLERTLEWEPGSTPTAEAFGKRLNKRWGRAGRYARAALFVGAGLAGLTIAGVGGQVLQPKPAKAARTAIHRGGVTLDLEGEWRSIRPPGVPGVQLDGPVAAKSGSTQVVAGRAASTGPLLISRDARASLPRAARKPHPVVIGEHAALRYGPAQTLGGGRVEILALPLERRVLVLRCAGPSVALPRLCAQVGADLELDRGSVQRLSPTPAMADQLRAKTSRLNEVRQRQRALLAAASSESEASAAAREMAGINHAFARAMAALPATAQDAERINAAASAARRAGEAYATLASTVTAEEWSAARTQIEQRDQELEAAIRRLASLPVYGP